MARIDVDRLPGSRGSANADDDDHVSDTSAGLPEYGRVLGAVALTFLVVGVAFMWPYVVDHLSYPTGWDAPAYTSWLQSASSFGLSHLGAIRSATPLLGT